jgi:hypothetical protein
MPRARPSQDFEAGNADGFAFGTGDWTVGRVGSGRLVWAINALAGFEGINSQPYVFEKDAWYLARAEVKGEQYAYG